MVKYYYDKYIANETKTWREGEWSTESSWSETEFAELYSTYSLDSATNVFRVYSKISYSTPVSVGQMAYELVGSTLRRYTIFRIGDGGNLSGAPQYVTMANKTTSNSTSTSSYTRGNLVQSAIAAENGTYPLDGRHTDGYWYVRGALVNTAPIINPNAKPSGTISSKPSFTYVVSDIDGQEMTVTESIDGMLVTTHNNVKSGSTLTFAPSDLTWLKTRINQPVNITITANDGVGGVTTVNYPVTRTTPAIDVQLKKPFETDVAAKRMLIQLNGSIPFDAVVSVQVCNNAFDTNPTWENATNLTLNKFPFPFTNKTKTAAKWGVSFKIRIERGSSQAAIYLDGIGGAYD